MVETALTIFALLFLTLGLLQAGMIYNAMLSLNNLSREGARYTALRLQDELSKIPVASIPESEAQLKAREASAAAAMKKQLSKYLQGRAKNTSISPDELGQKSLTIQFASIRSSQPVRVIITYNMKQNKGFVPALLPLPAPLANYQASAANLME